MERWKVWQNFLLIASALRVSSVCTLNDNQRARIRWLGTKNTMPQNFCSISSKNANGLLKYSIKYMFPGAVSARLENFCSHQALACTDFARFIYLSPQQSAPGSPRMVVTVLFPVWFYLFKPTRAVLGTKLENLCPSMTSRRVFTTMNKRPAHCRHLRTSETMFWIGFQPTVSAICT